jgi:ribosomal protein S18 acetylase RimI-like enzyme
VTIEVREEPIERLEEQGELSIAFVVDRMLVPTLVEGGLGGVTFAEHPVTPSVVKDYDVLDGEGPLRWRRSFDVSRWGFLSAWEGDDRVGGAVIAFDTPDVHLLDGRRDVAALWDLRVHPDRRSSGVGTLLWRGFEDWARARGCRDVKVETQNNNVTACRFYVRMGCSLGALHRFRYPDLPDEIQLLWYKSL